MLKLALLALMAAAPTAATSPDWAFPARAPTTSSGPPPAKTNPQALLRVAGGERAYSEAVVHDGDQAVDWRPSEHSPLPAIVARARQPKSWACGYCHLPAGEGRPENASLAGLPAAYIVRQVEAMKDAERTPVNPAWLPSGLMIGVAKAVTPEDLKAAAAYFSRQTFTARVRVVEGAMAPKVTPAFFVYKPVGRVTAPLGRRIIEVPADIDAFEQRDSHVTYTAYVPVGAIGRGAALARSGGPNARACASCHGYGLKGGVAPPIAGHSPGYLFRQLLAFQLKTRSEPEAADMQAVAAKLSQADMIDLAAYTANLKP